MRRAVARIHAWARAGAADDRFFRLFAGYAPVEVSGLAAAVTMYFPLDEHGKPPMLMADDDQRLASEGKRMSFFRHLCAVSRILQEDIANPDVLPGKTRPRVAVPLTSVPLQMVVMSFGPEDVREPEKLGSWAAHLTALDDNPAAARAARGTYTWSFGTVDETWHPEFHDPEVADFVRRFLVRVPLPLSAL